MTDTVRRTVLAYTTMIEEVHPLLPTEVSQYVLDLCLHIKLDDPKRPLQKPINASGADAIILGYGM
ncbi:MAG TPA: hypothetical protein PKO09_12925 [Anaerolineae bacterium]|nr:hypothetical protein [Anaerolineae bacterium]